MPAELDPTRRDIDFDMPDAEVQMDITLLCGADDGAYVAPVIKKSNQWPIRPTPITGIPHIPVPTLDVFFPIAHQGPSHAQIRAASAGLQEAFVGFSQQYLRIRPYRAIWECHIELVGDLVQIIGILPLSPEQRAKIPHLLSTRTDRLAVDISSTSSRDILRSLFRETIAHLWRLILDIEHNIEEATGTTMENLLI
jgi:hypothetical protein